MKTREEDLQDFVGWCGEHITGDEKGNAQIFLDRMFQAFGQGGVNEAGATLEMRVKNDQGGTSFADLVWKPVVLIEMKKRGVPLQKHYRQAFDYWTHLVPNRPRYVVLCNFDEFHIYDFETQMDSPVDVIALADLPRRWTALAFLVPGNLTPVFDNDRVAVTKDAAKEMAHVFNMLKARKVDPARAQRFILQMLVCFFSEDIGLLPKDLVTQLLLDANTPAESFDLLNALFAAMNSKTPAAGGRFKDVRYFNGGLFAESGAVELRDIELVKLREISKFQWEKVQPEIFGTLFEASSSDDQRRAFGQHFTHPADIMKIVGPTISQPWNQLVEGAKTKKQLGNLLERLHHFRVLDPACGSGNFLYLAYRELKRIEARIFDRIAEFKSSAKDDAQIQMGFLSVQNFTGMDINAFAVEVAKVTMMIARKLAKDELHITERDLPLDNLDSNFICGDALIDANGNATVWPAADVIIGNPPFLDARKMTVDHGRKYVGNLESLYPGVPRRADFCTYWIRKAHDALAECTNGDPVAGRAGLVGTQNIRNNESREGGLDHVVCDGTIIDAVASQPWSGEANVHVSIVNWVKTQDVSLLPAKKKLWFKVEPDKSTVKPRKRGTGSALKNYELDFRCCARISSALSDQADVTGAARLKCCFEPKVVFEGVQTGHDGFVINDEEAKKLLSRDPRHKAYVKPFINGQDLLSGRYRTEPEFVIDMSHLDMLQAAALPDLLAIPQKRVLGDWQKDAAKENAEIGTDRGEHQNRLDAWWALKRPRGDLQAVLKKLPRCVACSAVMKRPTFVFLSSEYLPTNALKLFTFADDYSFGILQSNAHWQWFVAKCSKLKSDFRYTPESVFDTYAWPQFLECGAAAPLSKGDKEPKRQSTGALQKIAAVAEAGREIRRIRSEALKTMKGGLRALYRTLELPGANPLKDAHAKLDAAVLAAYGFDPKGDLLAQLLELNQTVAARIAKNEPVTAPGLPAFVPNPAEFVTDDCIRP